MPLEVFASESIGASIAPANIKSNILHVRLTIGSDPDLHSQYNVVLDSGGKRRFWERAG
jgi:hypothetical protein